jgi:hypothetical protein
MRVNRHEPRTGEGGGERVDSESANCQSSGGRRIRKRERERESGLWCGPNMRHVNDSRGCQSREHAKMSNKEDGASVSDTNCISTANDRYGMM